jgi:hypothetical protein
MFNILKHNLFKLKFNLVSGNLVMRNFHLRQNHEKMEFINLIDRYMFKMNQNLSTTNCDVQKFLLKHEIDKLVKLKNKYNSYDISPKEIDDNKKELTTNYVNYVNYLNKNTK